jgi:hypothetical protein
METDGQAWPLDSPHKMKTSEEEKEDRMVIIWDLWRRDMSQISNALEDYIFRLQQ